MLRLEKLAWNRTSMPCPPAIITQFRKICFQQTRGNVYHAIIAFMYAVIQGDIVLDISESAKARPKDLLEIIADDEDDLDAFKIRIKKSGITLNTTEYIEEYFYSK